MTTEGVKMSKNSTFGQNPGQNLHLLTACTTNVSSKVPDIEAYQTMSKEELINELIKAKANELRAKKGYEVKVDGANKEFIIINRRNSK